MKTHEDHIRHTLRLARKGLGKTKTNPMAGAVLVMKTDGEETVIGQGFHRGFGKPHAEVEAVDDAKKKGYENFSRAVMYINLEPCCHYGKTPPCTDLIIKEKIPHVVFGTTDPFPEVAGKSISILRKAGVKTEYGFLENECEELNRAFFKVVRTGLPWITLKAAMTLDGYIADTSGHSRWISSDESRKLVHRWRSEHDAILAGAGTVIKDNPLLNVRLAGGKNPIRVIIDGKLRSPLASNVFQENDRQLTIVFTSLKFSHPKCDRLRQKGVCVISLHPKSESLSLKNAMKILVSDFHVSSVLVEGGTKIFGQFLNARLADEMRAFIAPKLTGDGLPWTSGMIRRTIGKAIQLDKVTVQQSGPDALVTGRIRY